MPDSSWPGTLHKGQRKIVTLTQRRWCRQPRGGRASAKKRPSMPATKSFGSRVRKALVENARARRNQQLPRLRDLVAPAGPTPEAPVRVRFAFYKNFRWLIGRPHDATWVERRGFPMAWEGVFRDFTFLCPRCLTGFHKWSEVIAHAKLATTDGDDRRTTESGCDCHDLLNPWDEELQSYKLETQKQKRRRWKLPARLR